MTGDVHAKLARQSLGRPLTEGEEALASALEAIFKGGEHDFGATVARLNADGIARPSGSPEPWTEAVLEAELAAINRSLDEAYVARGNMEPRLI